MIFGLRSSGFSYFCYMFLIDTHAHIYLEHFKEDINEVIERATGANIKQILMPNIDHTSIDDMLELADKFSGFCLPMMGLHPCSVNKDFEKELYLVEDWLNKATFIGVGEIGTDLYWDKTYWSQQQEALRIQLNLAEKHNLPFVIHCRESIDETIDIVEAENSESLTGVFHCFTGSLEQAERITEMGFKLGLGGVSTFKNGGLNQLIEAIDLEHVILETDSPYLAPAPNRGKRNEPAFITYVCEKIAEIRSSSTEQVSTITSENAIKLFKLNVG